MSHKDATERVAICKPRTEASRESNPTGTLFIYFQPPELKENSILLFKLPSLWLF